MRKGSPLEEASGDPTAENAELKQRVEALRGDFDLACQSRAAAAVEALELRERIQALTESRDDWQRIAEGSDSYVRTVTDKLRERNIQLEVHIQALEAALREYKAIVASLLYGSRMLPASYYRQQQALARRIGVDEDSPRVAALLSPSEAI